MVALREEARGDSGDGRPDLRLVMLMLRGLLLMGFMLLLVVFLLLVVLLLVGFMMMLVVFFSCW